MLIFSCLQHLKGIVWDNMRIDVISVCYLRPGSIKFVLCGNGREPSARAAETCAEYVYVVGPSVSSGRRLL